MRMGYRRRRGTGVSAMAQPTVVQLTDDLDGPSPDGKGETTKTGTHRGRCVRSGRCPRCTPGDLNNGYPPLGVTATSAAQIGRERARGAENDEVGRRRVPTDLLEQPPAVPDPPGQHPPPEIGPLARSPGGVPQAPKQREVEQHDGVGT